jgi:predicted flap endonuclease-1-like 5' DNA nuclease
MRIKGVGSEYADLLEAAGVDSVPELAQRNAANLAATLGNVNEAKNLVRRVPNEADVTTWVAEAKTLPKAVQY